MNRNRVGEVVAPTTSERSVGRPFEQLIRALANLSFSADKIFDDM